MSAGTDQTGNPVYFCYELELRHLLRVKQELGWKKQGTILCFSYQKSILEYYFGKEVSYREILTEKVMEYLEGLPYWLINIQLLFCQLLVLVLFFSFFYLLVKGAKKEKININIRGRRKLA